MKYKISQKAKHDIENIWLFTHNKWSFKQADRYTNLILNEIEYIAENPESGQDFSKIRKGYLRSRVKSHFIFYKINLNSQVVEIIRVLHQKMNIESRLKQ